MPTYERVPMSEMPRPRAGRRWPELAEEVVAAFDDGMAVKVSPMSPTEATNFSAYMRKRGHKVLRRHVDEGFYLSLEPK